MAVFMKGIFSVLERYGALIDLSEGSNDPYAFIVKTF
jgi:hypothetical protein